VSTDAEREAATAKVESVEQPRMLWLSCKACREYHQATYYKDYCERCQAGRRPT
jgi:hypothetical protein